jgi:hypothetical protein
MTPAGRHTCVSRIGRTGQTSTYKWRRLEERGGRPWGYEPPDNWSMSRLDWPEFDPSAHMLNQREMANAETVVYRRQDVGLPPLGKGRGGNWDRLCQFQVLVRSPAC